MLVCTPHASAGVRPLDHVIRRHRDFRDRTLLASRPTAQHALPRQRGSTHSHKHTFTHPLTDSPLARPLFVPQSAACCGPPPCTTPSRTTRPATPTTPPTVGPATEQRRGPWLECVCPLLLRCCVGGRGDRESTPGSPLLQLVAGRRGGNDRTPIQRPAPARNK